MMHTHHLTKCSIFPSMDRFVVTFEAMHVIMDASQKCALSSVLDNGFISTPNFM